MPSQRRGSYPCADCNWPRDAARVLTPAVHEACHIPWNPSRARKSRKANSSVSAIHDQTTITDGTLRSNRNRLSRGGYGDEREGGGGSANKQGSELMTFLVSQHWVSQTLPLPAKLR